VGKNFWLGLRKYAFEVWMLSPAFLFLFGFLAVVFFYLLDLSFTHVASNYTETFPSLKNFSTVFSSEEFYQAFMNTFVFVIIGTPLELAAGLFLAMLLAEKFRFRWFFRSIFIIPLAIPALVTAIIIFINFDYPGGHVNNILLGKHWFFPQVLDSPVNWRNSGFFALSISLLGKIWRDMPISMLILLAGLSSIPKDQYKAAETLGASGWQKFRYITVPLLIPAISTVLIMRSIEMWKEFIFPFVLAGRFPLLGTYIEILYHNWHKSNEAAVVCIVLVICIVISTLFLHGTLTILRRKLVRI